MFVILCVAYKRLITTCSIAYIEAKLQVEHVAPQRLAFQFCGHP